MLPLVIAGHNARLAENQKEYHALSIKRWSNDVGQPVMTSVWEPTPHELEILKAGGTVRLHILGTKHPPVMLDVQEPPSAM